jgi:pyruvate/2-oxoglutarate dehydrogenase complex dihydrolipoamide acyltransferase (E2) component
VGEIRVKPGDKVPVGGVILTLQAAGASGERRAPTAGASGGRQPPVSEEKKPS